MTARCPCGDPHLDKPAARLVLEGELATLPETMPVKLVDVGGVSGMWAVPRAWIAFHGLKGPEVPELAKRYGWRKLEGDWSHLCCDECWVRGQGARVPVRLKDPERGPCCWCGTWTSSGIYTHADPLELRCKGLGPNHLAR